jgi:uncharacterized glyoxalase superfamily protein PhnB
MNKLTPVLYVDAIERCLDFWVRRLGFEKAMELPVDDRLGFVILTKGAVEVMIQSRACVRMDVPALADMPSCTTLYIEVPNLAAIIRALDGVPVMVPRRTAPYGADEIFVREPGGNVVAFAEHKAQ